jgi:hypothetical protein
MMSHRRESIVGLIVVAIAVMASIPAVLALATIITSGLGPSGHPAEPPDTSRNVALVATVRNNTEVVVVVESFLFGVSSGQVAVSPHAAIQIEVGQISERFFSFSEGTRGWLSIRAKDLNGEVVLCRAESPLNFVQAGATAVVQPGREECPPRFWAGRPRQ